MNQFKSLKEMSDSIDAIMIQARKDGLVLFKQSIRELFNTHPVLDRIEIPMYTDYYNDGDSCTFSMRLYSMRISLIDGYYQDYEDNEICDKTDVVCELEPIVNLFKVIRFDCEEFFYTITNDIAREIFGDHTKVIICRVGDNVKITQKDYEHE